MHQIYELLSEKTNLLEESKRLNRDLFKIQSEKREISDKIKKLDAKIIQNFKKLNGPESQ